MLGHTIALLLKQKDIIQSPNSFSNVNNNLNVKVNENNNHDHKSHSQVIAIIAPATSKGIPIDQLDRLAIVKSLISSLYKTRSRLFFIFDFQNYIFFF